MGIAGFVVSYVIARQAFEPPDWDEQFVLALVTSLLLGTVYLVLLFWFYYHAPLFLALMSLPPRFNKYDERNMWDLLAYGVKHHVMETYMDQHAEEIPAILRPQRASMARIPSA